MYEFLATATDRQGNRSTRVVKAEKSHEAMAQLEADGFTEIILHTDDAGAVSNQVKQEDLDLVTPENMLEFRAMSTWGMFVFLLKNGFYSIRLIAAIAVAYITYSLYQGRPTGFLFYASGLLLLFPVLIAFYFSFLSPSRKYDQLIESWAWGRWQDVLNLAPSLRGKIPDLELDARMAVALAKTGHYEQGLATMTQYTDDPETPYWMYLARLAEFYYCAGETEQALAASRDAHLEDPDNPTAEFDYALMLLKLQIQQNEASQLLDSVEQKPLSDLVQMFLPFGRGLLALNQGYFSQACDLLLECRERLQPLTAQPLVRQVLDYNSAYLAIAYAHAGDQAEARQLFRPARKRLEAFGDELLLARLDAAMEKFTPVASF